MSKIFFLVEKYPRNHYNGHYTPNHENTPKAQNVQKHKPPETS